MHENTKFIFTDIHGNYLTLVALIDKVAKNSNITKQEVISNTVICGDLIDRGPMSKQIVDFCIENKIPVTMGNHEVMMIEEALSIFSHYIKNGTIKSSSWTASGGGETFKSYLSEQTDEDGNAIEALSLSSLLGHIDWMKKLPLYLEFEDIKNNEGRHLVCSHSQIHNVWRHRNSEEKMWQDRFKDAILWGRPHKIKDSRRIYNVHGHTPQKDGARVKTNYANIDTGCFYKREKGYAKLTCLQFPKMTVTEQENIDE